MCPPRWMGERLNGQRKDLPVVCSPENRHQYNSCDYNFSILACPIQIFYQCAVRCQNMSYLFLELLCELDKKLHRLWIAQGADAHGFFERGAKEDLLDRHLQLFAAQRAWHL